jgi:hypothetical protein
MQLAMFLLASLFFNQPLVQKANDYQFEAGPEMTKDVLEITYCELVSNPNSYFGKTARLKATITQADEGQYLNDLQCEKEARLGVGYVSANEKEKAAINKAWEQINSPEYAGRADVTVIGILRNESRRDFVWYDYRFDIISFENVSHAIIQYEGYLEEKTTYRAEVACNKDYGLWPVVPLKIGGHGHGVRIEWTNLKQFPELKDAKKKSCRKRIILRVLSKSAKQISNTQWRTIITCRVEKIE